MIDVKVFLVYLLHSTYCAEIHEMLMIRCESQARRGNYIRSCKMEYLAISTLLLLSLSAL